MRTQQIRKFDMLRRVQQFLDEFAVKLFAAIAAAARQALDQPVEDMRVDEAAQASNTLNAKSQTAAQAVLRHELVHDHMRPVALIAAAHLRDVPEFKALQVPKFRVKAAPLVQDANAMAEAAQPYREVFVGNGRPETFVDDLVAREEHDVSAPKASRLQRSLNGLHEHVGAFRGNLK
jgi:hypothetical protein